MISKQIVKPKLRVCELVIIVIIEPKLKLVLQNKVR